MKNPLFIITFLFFLTPLAFATEFVPHGDISGMGIRGVYNFTDINSTEFAAQTMKS